MLRCNFLSGAFEYDAGDLEGFRAGALGVSRLLGGEEVAVKVFEVPPGETVCPYHYEYVEKWLAVLEGEITLRTPGDEPKLVKGDVVCFPRGPAGAHKTTNNGSSRAL